MSMKKPRFSFLPAQAVMMVLRVMEHGYEVRKDSTWHREPESMRLDAAMRHLLARLGGDRHDPDSGLLHLAHATAQLIYALQLDIMAQGDRLPLMDEEDMKQAFRNIEDDLYKKQNK